MEQKSGSGAKFARQKGTASNIVNKAGKSLVKGGEQGKKTQPANAAATKAVKPKTRSAGKATSSKAARKVSVTATAKSAPLKAGLVRVKAPAAKTSKGAVKAGAVRKTVTKGAAAVASKGRAEPSATKAKVGVGGAAKGKAARVGREAAKVTNGTSGKGTTRQMSRSSTNGSKIKSSQIITKTSKVGRAAPADALLNANGLGPAGEGISVWEKAG
ncbi:MAG: hypothetical protein R3D67_01245 [Hyphomicrobiaceae bacterium]